MHIAASLSSTSGKKQVVLIDGYGFVFRAYHSLPPLTRPDGVAVGAVYGFTNMLLKFVQSHQADYFAVILDAGVKNFRHTLYPAYKANRPPAPEDLIPQFPIIREAAEAFSLPVIEKPGYEADDIIATYAYQAKKEGMQVVIISSDKDLMQLVDEDIALYDPVKACTIGIKEVQEKFGVPPNRVLDVLALMGDSSDNVPGVAGIGPKTAAELIQHYGDLDTLLSRADEITQPKRRETLLASRDKALLSRQLIQLCHTVDTPLPLEALAARPMDKERLVHFLQLQGFKSLVARFSKGMEVKAYGEGQGQSSSEFVAGAHLNVLLPPHPSRSTINSAPAPTAAGAGLNLLLPQVIPSAQEVARYLSNIHEISILYLFPLGEKAGEWIGMACTTGQGDSIYFPFPQREKKEMQQTSLFPEEKGQEGLQAASASMLEKEQKGMEEILYALRPWLEDPSVLKISHDIKPLYKWFIRLGIDCHAIEDVMLLSYVLSGGLQGHDLASMASRCGEEALPVLKKKEWLEIEEKKAAGIAACCLQVIKNTYPLQHTHLVENKLVTVYERIERPLVPVLAAMEMAGICIDTMRLQQLSLDFSRRLALLEKEIYSLAGHSFNVASPKQLGDVLFNEMQLLKGKKSKKTGAYSTGAAVLEELAEAGHDIAAKVLAWRQLSKLITTYTDTLPTQIKSDGRIHTHYAMTVTNTGRLSSNDPNLQNIPIRSEEGNKIREAFVAKKGYSLLSADYSQIELRLLAVMADIKPLLQAFTEGMDIHALTASQIFGIPLDQVDSEYRRRAKTINFGIIYGMSAFGLAARLGIGREEAKLYIDAYFKQYAGIKAYMDQSIAYARKHGYVRTYYGRKCFIKGIHDKNGAVRQFSERAAINAPLQGTAADIIKKAMIALPPVLRKASLDVTMLLQVHDELVFEVKNGEEEKATQLIRRVMENVLALPIPLSVSIHAGPNWAEVHK